MYFAGPLPLGRQRFEGNFRESLNPYSLGRQKVQRFILRFYLRAIPCKNPTGHDSHGHEFLLFSDMLVVNV